MPEMPLRVLVVADDSLVSGGLSILLTGQPDCTVVAQISVPVVLVQTPGEDSQDECCTQQACRSTAAPQQRGRPRQKHVEGWREKQQVAGFHAGRVEQAARH